METARARRSVLEAALAAMQQGLQVLLSCQQRLLEAMRQPLASIGRQCHEHAIWLAMLDGCPAILPTEVAQALQSISQVGVHPPHDRHCKLYSHALRMMSVCSLSES